MPDPLTLSVVGGWVALEGVKFLYGQAGELLKARRERRGDEPAESIVDVPLLPTPALDATPRATPVDVALLRQEGPALAELYAALMPHAESDAVDVHDAALAENAGRLRALLEALYAQRFTFAGEQREATGSRVEVRQVLQDVRGTVTGAEADVRSGEVSVEQSATTVDGTMTGFKGTLGR